MKRFLIYLIVLICITFVLAQSPVSENTKVELIQSGFSLAEGPFWHPDGYLLFSDVANNKIYKWTEENGIAEYLSPSGNANGITMDINGNILICQHSARQVGRIEADKSITPLATHYKGARLHSPNDLVVKSDGSIFFTDPPWGGNPQEMDFHGVYRIPAGGGDTQLLVDSLDYPNGITFSPDETKLYIDDAHKHIYVYDVVDDSLLTNGKLFATITGSMGTDGMKVDNTGNIYSTGGPGIVVYSPEGTLLDEIEIPDATTNLNWGGPNGKILFVTTFPALYKIDFDSTASAVEDDKLISPGEFLLHQNYPNPFNPTTKINYQLPVASDVELIIYNLFGQKVAALVGTKQQAGCYSVQWDAHDFASGIYSYQLRARGEKQKTVLTKKLILLK